MHVHTLINVKRSKLIFEITFVRKWIMHIHSHKHTRDQEVRMTFSSGHIFRLKSHIWVLDSKCLKTRERYVVLNNVYTLMKPRQKSIQPSSSHFLLEIRNQIH